MDDAPEPFVMRDLAYDAGRHLDVYRPHDDVDTLLPTLLYLHGGSFFGGDKADARSVAWCRELAQSGYCVVSANYSLGTGPCREERWSAWPQSLLDCRAALEFVWGEQYRIGADARLVGAMGSSAGATLALVLGFATEEQIAEIAFEGGLVPERAVTPNVRVVVNLCGRTDFRVHTPEERQPPTAERIANVSAVRLVTPGRRLPFVLTIHGPDDDVVPIVHAEMLHDAIVAVDEDHELWRLPGAGHGFGPRAGGHHLTPHVVEYLRRVFA
jgi:acetyl esterase/lipase